MIHKMLIPFLILAAIGGRAVGQPVFRQDFTDDDGRWKKSNAAVQAELAQGMLHLNTAGKPAFTYSHAVPVQADAGFTISASLKLTGPAGSAGIMWGSMRDHYAFAFNAEGNASVQRVSNGGYVSIMAWTPGPSIRAADFNTLTITCTASAFQFAINDVRVFETPVLTFASFSMGIYAGADTQLQCDYLTFNQAQRAVQVVENSAIRNIRDLGKTVNSTLDESTPCISANGTALYFSRSLGESNTDIFVSTWSNKVWTGAKNIGAPLNNGGPNYVVAVAVDEQTLFVANKYSRDGTAVTGEGISISRRTKNGWTVPRPMPVRNLTNHARFTYYNIAPNATTMVVSMQHQRERFDLDLYVSFLEKDSTWSSPVPLPASINTLAHEAMAYLASDNITLYYSTNGKPGYGEYDLFVTRRLDDTWMNWSEPLNLGRAVNSTESEMSISVPSRGRECYLVIETQNEKSNLFAATLPAGALPEAVTMVSGKVYNRKTNKPVEAEIEFENLSTQKPVGTVKSSAIDGSFRIALNKGAAYGLNGKAKGYYPLSTSIDIKNLKEYRELQRDLFLVPIEPGAVIQLNNLFFEVNNATLQPESYPELNRLHEFLTGNPNLRIEVAGHTDNTGSEAFNQELSLRRAQAVAQALSHKGGIQPGQITVRGYGRSRPVAPNNSEEGRQKNRRVEFTLLPQPGAQE